MNRAWIAGLLPGLTAFAMVAPAPAQERERVVVDCIDEAGEPVADAEVHVFQRIRLPDGKGEYRPFGPFRSDADGRARGPVALSYDGGRFDRWVYCRVPGRLVGAARALTSAAPGPAPLIQVRLCSSRAVRGVVRAPEGSDLAAVRVRILSMYILDGKNMMTLGGKTTDSGSAVPRVQQMAGLEATLPDRFETSVQADGSFVLDDVPRGVRLYLAAEGPGLGHAQYANLRFPEGWVDVDDPVHIEMDAESTLAGKLSTPDGAPVAGAKLTARISPLGSFSVLYDFDTTSDERGRFRIGGLPAAELELSVDTGDRPWRLRPVNVTVRGGQALGDVELQLERGVRVAGTVTVAGSGDPVAGASVTAVTDSQPSIMLGSARSDDDGSFELLLPRGIARFYLSGLPSGYTGPTGRILDEIDVRSGDPKLLQLGFEVDRKNGR